MQNEDEKKKLERKRARALLDKRICNLFISFHYDSSLAMKMA